MKKLCSVCNKYLTCRYAGPKCYTCYSKSTSQHYKKLLNKNKLYLKSSKGLFARAKAQATRRHIVFELSYEDFVEIRNKNCFYCGEKVKSEVGLDRIDNNKNIGYTKDNILCCCGNCNQLRGNRLTVEETVVAIKAIQQFRRKKKIEPINDARSKDTSDSD